MTGLTIGEIYRVNKYSVMVNELRVLRNLDRRTTTLKDLQTTTKQLVCKHILIVSNKIIREGNSISDIPKLQLSSLHKEEK